MKKYRNKYKCKYLKTKAVKKTCNNSSEEESTVLKPKKKTPCFCKIYNE